MKNNLVSIIIPVYNIDKYLERCLKSVIDQTYSNLEIILVNDGSTDNSLDICHKYQKKDNRIIVIDKKNGGLSSARNIGLEVSKGKYVTFIDSDDWVSTKYIEILYGNIIKNDADISIVDFVKITTAKINDLESKANITNVCLSSAEFALNHHLPVMACAKLYKLSLFNNLRFTENIVFEDEDIMYKLFYKSEKIVYSEYIGYFYFQRNQSITAITRNKNNIIKSSDSLILIIENKEKFFENKLNLTYKFYIDSVGMLSRYYASCFLYPFNSDVIQQRKKIKRVISELLGEVKGIDSFNYKLKYFVIKYFVLVFLFKK
jgi:glycosyltransferase involved in cell wall biosynthesis